MSTDQIDAFMTDATREMCKALTDAIDRHKLGSDGCNAVLTVVSAVLQTVLQGQTKGESYDAKARYYERAYDLLKSQGLLTLDHEEALRRARTQEGRA